MTTGREAPSGAARPSYRQQMGRLAAVVLALDVLTIAVSMLLAWWVPTVLDVGWFPATDASTSGGVIVAALLPVWVVVLAARGAYKRYNLGVGVYEFRAVANGSLIALGVLSFAALVTASGIMRRFLVIGFLLGVPLLILVRWGIRKVVHRLRRDGRFRGTVVAVCQPDELPGVVGALHRIPYVGYSVVAHCVPGEGPVASPEGSSAEAPLPVYCGTDRILEACRDTGADTVLVAGGAESEGDLLRRLSWRLERQQVDLLLMPSMVDIAGPRIHLRHLEGVPLMHVDEPQAVRARGWPKRIFDVVAASGLLVLFSPVMALAAVLVRLEDGRPVLYRQQRCGLHEQQFWMTKFRSMQAGADQRVAELRREHGTDAGNELLFKLKDDPRVTRVGRWLRRYSIDELPQLVDVLRGDMSMVGPRPPLPAEVEQYPEAMERRLLVRPGITGLWQVSGRSDLSLEDSIRHDIYYVDNWSITGDLFIMIKTVRAVLSGAGAH